MKNAREMKAANRLGVLRILRQRSLSRSELAEATGLTRAAMSLIVGELLADGILVETGSRESAAGRRPVPIELCPEYAYSLGLTISRTGAEAGVADLAGQLLCRVPIGIAGLALPSALRRLKRCLQDLIAKYSRPGGRWLGLGISTPGPVDVTSGTILNPPNFDIWHDICLVRQMKNIGIGHIFLENNAQALTMAEKAFGVGRETRSFVLLVVEAGIGGGIVRRDELYSGWHGFGNEIGHTSIDWNGPRCKCGLHGCLEMFASLPNVLAAACKHDPRLGDWRAFMDSAAAGNRWCVGLLDEQARALGTAAVNVINVLELDAVVLTGDILYRGEMVRERVERFLATSAVNRWVRHIPVYLSPLGERPELMAAAGIPAEKYFQGVIEPQPMSRRRLGPRR